MHKRGRKVKENQYGIIIPHKINQKHSVFYFLRLIFSTKNISETNLVFCKIMFIICTRVPMAQLDRAIAF